jgi:effector-binding domain-containing protein
MLPHIANPDMDATIKEIPEQSVATVSHLGPYPRIAEAFARPGSSLEIYRNTPATTPPEQLTTELCIPVT